MPYLGLYDTKGDCQAYVAQGDDANATHASLLLKLVKGSTMELRTTDKRPKVNGDKR